MTPLDKDALRLLQQRSPSAPAPVKLADFERRRQEIVDRSKALSAAQSASEETRDG